MKIIKKKEKRKKKEHEKKNVLEISFCEGKASIEK